MKIEKTSNGRWKCTIQHSINGVIRVFSYTSDDRKIAIHKTLETIENFLSLYKKE